MKKTNKAISKLVHKISQTMFLSDLNKREMIDCVGDSSLAYRITAVREAEAVRMSLGKAC